MAAKTHRILFADDHADTCELVRVALSLHGFVVSDVGGYTSALERAKEEKFDAYLLDNWMPDGTGVDLCRSLREFDQKTPILFYSAAAYHTDEQAARRAGANYYFTKPGSIEDIISTLQSLLKV